MDESLIRASQLRFRLMGLETLVAVPALLVMVLYTSTIMNLTAVEWRSFAIVLLAYGVVTAVLLEPFRKRELAPLIDCLRSRESGELPHEALRGGFRAVMRLPNLLQRTQLIVWLLAAPFIAGGMILLGNESWMTGFRLFGLGAVALTGGLLSGTVVYFAAKEMLAGTRHSLAREFVDPEERRGLVVHVPIAWKVRMALAGSGIALVIFMASFAYSNARSAVEEMAAGWGQAALAHLADRIELGEQLGSAQAMVSNQAFSPLEMSFRVVDLAGDGESVSTYLVDMWRSGEREGSLTHVDPELLLAWRTLSDGRVVLAEIPRSQIDASFTNLSVALVVGLALGVAMLLGVSQLLARDVSNATAVLAAEAERMAEGDLRRGEVFESEDELGELSRSFERMGVALRSTVARVAEAADRVDGAASDMAAVSESVSTATADQVSRIHQAGDIMGEINTQVAAISASAQALNASVEESSSSILELGAAGDELNDTASVLSSKVEDTTSSIEQMVTSVKQVKATSESLSDVAAETSSSMEEMASAMRAVDTTAELTARLSNDVVASAESGQQKVSQTIDGMQAISDATTTAEQVIRGLGARTKEIGAILDVIDDVADETNLLALNAAIIAAQAGEHGRAFSVVADEIKELADRVLASTKEIGGLITAVQDESSNAIGAIEEGSRSVASGVELSAEAGSSLEEITRASRESGERIGQIVTAVREQTKAAGFVVSLMDRVRTEVEQIALAGSRQDEGNEVVYRSSMTMREVAQQVRRTTEEQSRGFGRIRESVEGVREAVEQINGSLQNQSSSCNQVADFLEQVSQGTRSNEDAVNRLGESIRGLVLQAELLREDVKKFQV